WALKELTGHYVNAAPEQVQYGAEHYRVQSADMSTIAKQLFAAYHVEGLTMPYTIHDFKREIALENLHELTVEERVHGLSPEELLSALPAQQIEVYLKRLQ